MPQSTLPPHSEPAGIVLLHDARAIHDTGTLSILAFTPGRGGFVVAVIAPAEGSGGGTIPGAYINSDTGQFVSPPGAALVVNKSGKWQLIASSRRGMTGGVYSWSDPPAGMKRITDPEDHYSPFVRGGSIVFRPHGEAGKAGYFEDPHLLFDNWIGDFAPAVRLVEEHPALFSKDVKPEADSQLLSIVRGPNRLLAVEAFRSLLVDGRMSLPVGEQYLAAFPDPRMKAILAYLLVTTGDDLVGVSNGTHDTVALKAIALGAYSAQLLAGHRSEVNRCAHAALAAIAQKLTNLGVPVGSDLTLSSIFQSVFSNRK